MSQIRGTREQVCVGIFATLAAFIFFFSTCAANGQGKYHPEHPEVMALVEKAIKYLEKEPTKATLGEQVLCALAIVESQKRYLQEVPKDHPVVKIAIEKIRAKILAGEGIDLNAENEVYVPALATILLAEVDKNAYRREVQHLVEGIQKRILSHGGINYMNQEKTVGDTSQLQYAALALYVANIHGFKVDPELAKRMLDWLIVSQQSTGTFHYKLQRNANSWSPKSDSVNSTLSIHTGGLGTVYLLADMLQLFPRKKSMTKVAAQEQFQDLPKTVMVYVPPIDGGEDPFRKEGPVVEFALGRLTNSVGIGNRSLEKDFLVDVEVWNFYYLYALERYAWFREQAEGSISGGKVSRWYDEGVNFLKKSQDADGKFFKLMFSAESEPICTSFAILFLVRSSEVISLPNADSELVGDLGFPSGILDVRGTNVVGGSAEKDINAMLKMLQEDPTEEQLEALSQSMKAAIADFNQMPDKSRGEVKTFLRTMITSENFFRRKIAVRFLAAEQDMDNVPALIFALGDPSFEICLEAHDGLRLISRRIDSMNLTAQTRRKSEDPYSLTPADEPILRSEYNALKRQWTQWYLKIRPSAELFD